MEFTHITTDLENKSVFSMIDRAKVLQENLAALGFISYKEECVVRIPCDGVSVDFIFRSRNYSAYVDCTLQDTHTHDY